MADQQQVPNELAQNIVRNVVPLDMGGKVGSYVDQGAAALQNLLRSLGLLPSSAQAYKPQLNEPLPYRDPTTGQMVYPQGYRGPR